MKQQDCGVQNKECGGVEEEVRMSAIRCVKTQVQRQGIEERREEGGRREEERGARCDHDEKQPRTCVGDFSTVPLPSGSPHGPSVSLRG